MASHGKCHVAGQSNWNFGEPESSQAGELPTMTLTEKVRKREGFTIVEILVAVFIALTVLGSVYVSMTSAHRSTSGMERKVAAQQDVRAALDIMAMEISMASYNPNFMGAGVWKNPPNLANPCTGVSGNQAWKGIQEATPTSITVEMDIGASNDVGDNPNEIIRYSYDAAQQAIFRNTCGVEGDVSFLGDISGAPAGTRTVRVVNNLLGIPIFRYYNSRDPADELHPDTTPADYLNIRRIDISLAVQTEEIDPSTGQFKQINYSTSVLVRNHVVN